MKLIKAFAYSGLVIAPPSATALPTGLVPKPPKDVTLRDALFEGAVGAAVPRVAQAPPDLHGVPELVINKVRPVGKQSLREAKAAIIAVVPATAALASQAFERRVAGAFSCIPIAHAPVGALHPWMGIIIAHHAFVSPGKPFRTRMSRTIDAHPLLLPVEPRVAIAPVAPRVARPMPTAVILTQPGRAVFPSTKLCLDLLYYIRRRG